MPRPASSRLSALRSPAALMAGGMLLFAAAGYAFVVLASRTLPKDQATLATSFYFLANVVGPGVFFALEQTVSRATSTAITHGSPLAPVVRRGRVAGLRLVAVVTVALAALAPLLGAKTLHGDWILYAEVLLMPAVAVNLHFVRGLLAGRQLFGAYSATLAAEGLSRLALCAAVTTGGASSARVFGLAFVGATGVAALVGFAALRARDGAGAGAAADPVEAPTAAPFGFGKGLAALALASLFSQLLPNLAPLAVNSRLDPGSALALAFAQAAVVARIPLLFFLPIQAMILPRLTAAAARDDVAEVRSLVKKILAATVGAGTAGAALFALTGSWALRTFFGATLDLSPATLLGLAASSVVLMAVFALQPALLAFGRDPLVTAGWALGSVITGAVAVFPLAAVPAATLGQLFGPMTAAALFTIVLVRRLRDPTVSRTAMPSGTAPAAHAAEMAGVPDSEL